MRPLPHLKPIPVRGRITKLQPKGLPVINMGYNELAYPPTPNVATALQKAASQAQSYGGPYCDALRDKLGAVNGIDPKAIICGNGSEELLDVIGRVFARPGDEILISEFGYIQFALIANRVGANLVKVREKDFTTDVDALLASVSDKTRVLYLANPNNPTGTMIGVDALSRLAQEVPKTVVLVLDLAYGEFAGNDYCAQVHQLVLEHENVIVTRTFSKAYGLAGCRVGWCHTPEWMVPVLYAARGMGPVNALAQAASLAALDERDVVAERVSEVVAERNRVAKTLAGIGMLPLPSHSNFLLVPSQDKSATTTEAIVEHLFDAGGIIVNRTREAGLEAYFRFSLSLPQHNDLLLDCIGPFAPRGAPNP